MAPAGHLGWANRNEGLPRCNSRLHATTPLAANRREGRRIGAFFALPFSTSGSRSRFSSAIAVNCDMNMGLIPPCLGCPAASHSIHHRRTLLPLPRLPFPLSLFPCQGKIEGLKGRFVCVCHARRNQRPRFSDSGDLPPILRSSRNSFPKRSAISAV